MTKFRLIFVVLLALSTVPAVYAADISVNDECSLTDAIVAANTDKAVGECIAGDGADVITLSVDVQLTTALPMVSSTLTIEGEGHEVRGNNRTHILGVNTRGNLVLNNVTISNGRSGWGGAIGNLGGKLTINDSIVSDNFAEVGGAIGNEGTLIIRDSTISSNKSDSIGGAIINRGGTITISTSIINSNASVGGGSGGAIFNDDGTLVIEENSVLLNNQSGYKGGAIYNDEGTLVIVESSFESNQALERIGVGGGAIYNFINKDDKEDDVTIVASTFRNNRAGLGGAIYNDAGNLYITNSTFVGNSANGEGGALYHESRDLTEIRNSTFYRNSVGDDGYGGAIFIDDSGFGVNTKAELFNNIIAQSMGNGDCYGKPDAQSNNLIQDYSCFPMLGGDPMLGNLVEPGDDSPAYFPLLEGSPAIDVANDEFCAEIDQIGTARPQGVGCDIGAIEFMEASD